MKYLLTLFLSVFLSASPAFSQIGGYSLYLDGSDDYVDCGYSSNLNPTTAMTIEMWVYLTNPAANQKLMSKFNWSASSGFLFGVADNNLYVELFAYNSGRTQHVIKNGTISSNTWTHLAISYTAGAKMVAYINGVRIDSTSTPYSMSTSNSAGLLIGKWDGFNTAGRFDEVRVWHAARTDDQIKAYMYKELSGNETGLRAYYKMSNGSGTTLSDNQTNVTANNGTLYYGPVWKTSGCFAGPRKCLNLDGSDDYVNCGSHAATRITNNMTISVWAKTSASDIARDIVTNQWSHSVSGFLLGITSAGKIHYAVSGAGSTMEGYDVNFTINDNKWHYITVTFASGVIKTYVDGQLVDTHTSSITAIVYSGSIPLNIGRDSGTNSEYWKGAIDELSIWSAVLSDADIREYMTRSLVGNETGLAAYYRFDEYDGTTLYDITSNAVNGVISADLPSGRIASSAFNTWLGGESGVWTTAANWSTGAAPVSSDNVGIYKWNLGNELVLSSSPSLENTTVSSTSSPTLSSNCTISKNLILNRDLNLNGYTITLGSSGNLVEGNYRLYGTSGSITTTRTLSNITAQNVAGLGLTITTSANMGSTTITRGHVSQGSNYSITRYYDVSPTTNTGLNATIVFGYSDNELNGATESSLKLYRSTNAGVNWVQQTSSDVNTTANTITLTGVNGFSRWTAANSNSPLPVSLLSFTSETNGRNITLNWKTSSEYNNAGFEVQRKTETSEWTAVSFINGKGTVNSVSSYSFADKVLNPGKFFYRLKQTDFNGNYAYFELAGSVVVKTPEKFCLNQNYPNPFNPSTRIDFELPEDSHVTITVFDLTGREVMKPVSGELKTAGWHSLNLDCSVLPGGIYFYSLSVGGQTFVKKMVFIK